MTILLVHAAATLFMTGLIWFVQVVHYPLLANVGADGFAAYAQRHSSLTTWVAGPAMLIELGAAMALVADGRVPRIDELDGRRVVGWGVALDFSAASAAA